MKQLFLIRHGQSTSNLDPTLYFDEKNFDHSFGLTPLGQQQALDCGKRLKDLLQGEFNAFVSPYTRARETWAGIQVGMNREPKTFVIDGRIREQEFRIFKSMDDYEAERVLREARGKLAFRSRGGESGYDVIARVGGFYNQLRMDWMLGNLEDRVVVVAHEIVVRCFKIIALQLPPEEFENMWIKNAEIHVLKGDESLKFRSSSTMTD